MANNFQVNVYQFNQQVYPRDQSLRLGFPTGGVIIQDVSGSPTRSLSSGYNVYGLIIVPSGAITQQPYGNMYYTQETLAQLSSLIG